MYHKLIHSGKSEKLTVTFLVWTFLLIFAGTITSTTDLSADTWIGATYWAINGFSAAVVTVVAVLAWRYVHAYRFALIVIAGATAFAISHLFLRTTTIWVGNHPLAVITHLLIGTMTLGAALSLVTTVFVPAELVAGPAISRPSHRFFVRSILLTCASFLILLLTGAVVANTATGLACPDWPLCQGELIPAEMNLNVAINLLHRLSTVVFGVLVAAIVLQARRHYAGHRLIRGWAKALGFVFLAQIFTGAFFSLMGQTQVVKFFHLGFTAAVWGVLVVLATISYLIQEAVVSKKGSQWLTQPDTAVLSFREKAVIYFKLTKPWIMVLLLLTTITAMFIAAEGMPALSLMWWTVLGGVLSAGGASVLNSYVDSDIDQVMSRTSRRATATGLVSPQETLVFGLGLSMASFFVFAVFVNTLSAILSTTGIIYYVFFYTLYLKRTTIHNIIIGGAAGAIPPLVGWTAVTNRLDLGALYLFAIIFFWTPPHTWALALLVAKDYARARVPMLPVIVGEKETTYQILLYSILLVILTLLPFTFGMVGWPYLIVAGLLGVRLIHLAWKLWRNFDKALSKRLYKYSQAYLALLFLVMAIDRSIF